MMTAMAGAVDAFAALRRRLYAAHGPYGSPGASAATRELYRALLGEQALRDSVAADVLEARLAAEEAVLRPGSLPTRTLDALLLKIPSLGSSCSLDRTLTEAISASLPELGPDIVSARLAAAASTAAFGKAPGSASTFAAILEAAAALRLPALPVESVLQSLDSPEPDLRAACAHYAAALCLGDAVQPLLEASAREGQMGVSTVGDRALQAAADALAVAEACGEEPAAVAAEADKRLARPGLASALLYADLRVDPAARLVVQTMFYGDPSFPGRGDGGGVATLLRGLGDALATHGLAVLTVVLYNTAEAAYPYRGVERLGPGHLLVRVPIHLSPSGAPGFLRGHDRLRAALRRLYHRCGARPRVVHVRFLDDASLAAAREAVPLGAALVVTLTPDPHRGLCDPAGNLRQLPLESGLEALNRISIGDELLHRSRAVVGIGRYAIRQQLLPYFPQLEGAAHHLVAGIDEGVSLPEAVGSVDVPALLTDPRLRLSLASPWSGRPLILNVGRLSPLKGQVLLLRAWLDLRWWERCDLVLVGGDLQHPAAGEADVLAEIHRLADAHPPCRGHLAHLHAMANDEVRALEAFLGARSLAPHPDLYVCASYKEEFGLSVLEAMAAGMIACAPLRGGARRYLRHGVNGFLVDTTTAESLRQGLDALPRPFAPGQVQALQDNARETVRRGYSLQRVAGQFVQLYDRVQPGT